MSMRLFTSRLSADRHGNALGRATIEQTDDTFPMQQVQTKNFFQEAMDDIEHVHPYGFSSNPQKPDMMGGIKRAAEAFFSFLGGNRSHGVVIVTGDRRFRLFNMKPGEVALHDDQGHQVHLTRNGIVFSAPNSKKIMMQIMQSDTLPQQSSGTSQSQTSGGGGQYGQTPQATQPTVATLQKDKNAFAVNHPVQSTITAPQNTIKGTTQAQVTAPDVEVSGTNSTNVTAPTVNISGTGINISGTGVAITGSLSVNGVAYGGGGGGGPGSQWYISSGAPTITVGRNNNDMDLDTTTGNVYQFESSAWGLVGNIAGPTGATGATGPTGPTGPAGGPRTQRSATSSPIVVSSTDQILNVNISSGSPTCSLPQASTRNGASLTFKDVGGHFTAHNLTLSLFSGDTIDGSSINLVLNNNYEGVTIVPFNDGTNIGWAIE